MVGLIRRNVSNRADASSRPPGHPQTSGKRETHSGCPAEELLVLGIAEVLSPVLKPGVGKYPVEPLSRTSISERGAGPVRCQAARGQNFFDCASFIAFRVDRFGLKPVKDLSATVPRSLTSHAIGWRRDPWVWNLRLGTFGLFRDASPKHQVGFTGIQRRSLVGRGSNVDSDRVGFTYGPDPL